MLASQPLDSTATYEIGPLLDGLDNPITTLGAANVFVWHLWPGGGTASVANGAGTLQTPFSGGLVDITITKASIAGLAPGIYRIEVLLDPGVSDTLVYRNTIRLTAAPGTAVLAPVYCSRDDLTLYCDWVDELEDALEDISGLAKQRGRARSMLDDVLVTRFKPTGGVPTMGQAGYAAWMLYGGSGDIPPSKWLRDQLAANYLIVRDVTREITARWAIALACESQIGRDKSPYPELGRYNRRLANNLLKTYRGEIDLNADGYPEITINCGATSLR